MVVAWRLLEERDERRHFHLAARCWGVRPRDGLRDWRLATISWAIYWLGATGPMEQQDSHARNATQRNGTHRAPDYLLAEQWAGRQAGRKVQVQVRVHLRSGINETSDAMAGKNNPHSN